MCVYRIILKLQITLMPGRRALPQFFLYLFLSFSQRLFLPQARSFFFNNLPFRRLSLCFSVHFLEGKSLLRRLLCLSLLLICSFPSVFSLPLKMAFSQSEGENELCERAGQRGAVRQRSERQTDSSHTHTHVPTVH